MNKYQVPSINKKKEIGLKNIMDSYQLPGKFRETNFYQTNSKENKQHENQTDLNRTGNKPIKLNSRDQIFLDLLKGKSNPT